jgi:predicted flavoprotein YhiN
VPLEKGEVVAGGVSLSEVDPQTMASKLIQGLYLCGEVLDVAGPVGGYNLQAAFATGYVAGESAAND